MRAVRGSFGARSGFVRGPFGFRSGSVWRLLGPVRFPLGARFVFRQCTIEANLPREVVLGFLVCSNRYYSRQEAGTLGDPAGDMRTLVVGRTTEKTCSPDGSSGGHIVRALYSNRSWRETKIESVFFEPVWRGKLFQLKVFASKSMLSSRFFRPFEIFRAA